MMVLFVNGFPDRDFISIMHCYRCNHEYLFGSGIDYSGLGQLVNLIINFYNLTVQLINLTSSFHIFGKLHLIDVLPVNCNQIFN